MPGWSSRAGLERALFAALAALAAAASALVPTYPNYDSYFALVWGNELLDGHLPSLEAYAAPTQHPLWIVWSALLDLVFGGTADRALVLTCVLSLVALVWAVFRVGRACFGPLAGVVGALCCGSSFALLLYAARAYVDVPFLALVLWAAALEAERPRRGLPVAALLAVAGLLRPEAWVLSGLYWLWLVAPARGAARPVARSWHVAVLVLVVAAPLIWALSDLVVTGDPLFSVTSTSKLADALGRERGLSHVPGSFVSFLADTARPPVFLAGLAGLVLAWRRRAELAALHVPYALFGAGALTFVGTGVLGLSILPRYLTVPVIALCLFAGYLVAGFERLPAGTLRRWWTRGAVVAVVLGVAFVAIRLGSFRALRAELRFIHQTHRDVAATAADPDVLRCGPLTLPTYRLIPDLRFELDAAPSRVLSRAVAPAGRGTALVLVGTKPVKRFGRADGVRRGTNVAPAGFAEVARHGMLVAYARRGC